MDKRQRMTLLGIAAAIAVVAVAVALVGGGDDEESKTTSQTTAADTTSAPTTDAPAQIPEEPDPEQIEVKDGEPVGGAEEIEVEKGDRVEIEVSSDEQLPIHLHGYDLERPAAPGKPARFRFRADIEGVFEMEIESTATPVAELTVKP